MKLIRVLLAASVAATLSIGTMTVSAQPVREVVWIREAPPPMREEVVPGPRAGYAWAPGYWQWQGRHHVWHRGTWVRERRGYVYSSPTWVEHDGRWEFRRGAWARGDADHDGVPNGADRRPNDPTRH